MAYQSDEDRREINRRTEQYEQENREKNSCGDYANSRARAEREVKWSKPVYRTMLRNS